MSISVRNVNMSYKNGKDTVKVLNDISFEVDKGEFLLITGASGSGKSTLLNLIGGLARFQGGEIEVDGLRLSSMGKDELSEYRADKISFIFQSYNLLNNLNVNDNIRLVEKYRSDIEQLEQLLESVGLFNKGKEYPATLSGGEQQRVSVARALAKDSDIFLCDEPTGALDSYNGQEVMKLLRSLVNKGKIVIVVTHNTDYIEAGDRVLVLKDGRIIADR